MLTCPVCGGRLCGDGYTVPLHCENVDILSSGLEPDCDPVFCEDVKGGFCELHGKQETTCQIHTSYSIG